MGTMSNDTNCHPSRFKLHNVIPAPRIEDTLGIRKILGNPVQVRALNGPEEWGPSDHCRVEIVVA